MAIFTNDYQTIKGSPTKDLDDISVGDMKTNGYSIVRSAMLAGIIAIVAVVGVVTFHQSHSLSNGYEPSMSSMALVHEDDGGYSNIDMEAYAKVLATTSEDELGKEMTVIAPPPSSKEDSAMNCGNLNYVFRAQLFVNLGMTTYGCASLGNGSFTGGFYISFNGQWLGPFTLPASPRRYSPFQVIQIGQGQTITVLVGLSSAGRGSVTIGLRASSGPSERFSRFPQSF